MAFDSRVEPIFLLRWLIFFNSTIDTVLSAGLREAGISKFNVELKDGQPVLTNRALSDDDDDDCDTISEGNIPSSGGAPAYSPQTENTGANGSYLGYNSSPVSHANKNSGIQVSYSIYLS